MRQAPGPGAVHTTVHAAAITHNTRLFVERTRAQVMAVVKADGYGHGAVDVARAAIAGGATWLGVTSLSEALNLRMAGLQEPILSWLNAPHVNVEAAVRARIDLAVSSVPQLLWCAAAASALVPVPVRIHLHVDTGIARDGAPRTLWTELCVEAARLEQLGLVQVVGIMSHMAHADTPHSSANTGAKSRFVKAVTVARQVGLTPIHRHLAATSAALNDAQTHHTMVRIGAGLVGIDLSGTATEELMPAMTMSAPVLMVREVSSGTPVGYGGSWRARERSLLATVQGGYADGVPRAAGGRAYVQLGGKRCPIVGRVSMDQFVVNATGAQVRAGDTALLWGPGTRGEPTVREWAQWLGTIDHEIVTGIGARVERRVDRSVPSPFGDGR